MLGQQAGSGAVARAKVRTVKVTQSSSCWKIILDLSGRVFCLMKTYFLSNYAKKCFFWNRFCFVNKKRGSFSCLSIPRPAGRIWPLFKFLVWKVTVSCNRLCQQKTSFVQCVNREISGRSELYSQNKFIITKCWNMDREVRRFWTELQIDWYMLLMRRSNEFPLIWMHSLKLTSILVLGFILCWTPYNVMSLW